jgi:hypothetical protein
MVLIDTIKSERSLGIKLKAATLLNADHIHPERKGHD